MTVLVITNVVMANILDILAKWPSRQAVLEDARIADPDLELVAVHRWYQRGSIPARYWRALISGAQLRGLSVADADFVDAHAGNPPSAAEVA